MNLYILRHAIADKRDAENYPDDSKRPLTPEGVKKMQAAARGMVRWGLEFDVIVTSPFERARHTAEIVAHAFQCEKTVQFSSHLKSEGDPAELIAELQRKYRQHENILLVGHESYLSRLISVLICGGPHAGLLLKKGGLAGLHTEQLNYGACATLEWLLTPRQLRSLSDS
jgi:phosphohistidine phosphatase